MLSSVPIKAGSESAAGYADYMENEADADRIEDYYTNESGSSKWHGGLAATLGLEGERLQKGELAVLLAGHDPKTGAALANNAGEQHRPGWDLTFSAPKSVSVAWGVGDDAMKDAISAAQDRASVQALHYLEQRAFLTRDRGDAQVSKIIAAVHQHGTSREKDPQLHTHYTVANIGQRADGSWAALDFDTRWKMATGAIYRAELAAEMQKLGFAVERDGDSFRLADIDRDVEKHFSQRRAQIQAAIKQGYGSNDGNQSATMATRKGKELSQHAELLEDWRGRAAEYGITPNSLNELCSAKARAGRETKPPELFNMAADKEILARLTAQASTVTEMQLHAEIARQAQGKTDAAGILARIEAIKSAKEIVHLEANGDVRRRMGAEARYTSVEMRDLEQRMATRAEAMAADRGAHAVGVAALAGAQNRRTLTAEQAHAFAHVTSDNRLAVVQGMAGTGKSFMLGAARDAWEDAGYRVTGCALAGKAAESLENGSNIRSQTVHSLLNELNESQRKLNERDVIVLDEAGMLGSRQMAQLMDHIDQAGGKLVIVGDTQQLQPIDAGGSMRAIEARVGSVRMEDIQRQKGAAQAFDRAQILEQIKATGKLDTAADEAGLQKLVDSEIELQQKALARRDQQTVRDFASGDAAKAMSTLKDQGRLHVAAPDQVTQRLVDDWHASWDPVKPSELLMIAGTRGYVRELNERAREAMGLTGKGYEVETERGTREFAVGDRLLFLQNNRNLGVKNGTLGTVEKIEFDNELGQRFTVLTDVGEKVKFSPQDYQKFDHGYAITAHKSQGVTVDRVYVLDGSMADREWIYVAMSRHRVDVNFYTTPEATQDMARRLAISHQKDTSLDYSEKQQRAPGAPSPQHMAQQPAPLLTQPHRDYEPEA